MTFAVSGGGGTSKADMIADKLGECDNDKGEGVKNLKMMWLSHVHVPRRQVQV